MIVRAALIRAIHTRRAVLKERNTVPSADMYYFYEMMYQEIFKIAEMTLQHYSRSFLMELFDTAHTTSY